MPSDSPPKGQRRAVRIGKYEVLDHIATGGMGAVYKARDTETDRQVALKILSTEAASKPALVERFRREARNAKKLQHENIVAVYDFDEEKGTYYLAMEFVDGIDLHEYIERKGTLEPEESRQIAIQACRALSHAYQQEIVHRDIKPSNFLLTRKDKRLIVKLADLGLSRETSNDEFRVTRAGTTVGTVDYMSPEQARDSGSADIRSDLYSLGCTWFHMLTGQAPFPKGGLTERLVQHMEDEPPDVCELNPKASTALRDVLDKLLAKDPDDRYQTPAELLDELLSLQAVVRPASQRDTIADDAPPIAPSRALSGARKPSSARRKARRSGETAEAPAARRPRRGLWIGAAAAALLLGGALGVWLAVRPRADKPGPAVQRPPRDDPGKRDADPVKDAAEKDRGARDSGPKDGAVVKVEDPPKARWKPLYQPAEPFTREGLQALRDEAEKPWAGQEGVPADARVVHVGRVPDAVGGEWFPSLTDAVAAKGADKVRLVEVHDNGPLYENPPPVADRRLIVRAARGYRPLLVWDVQRTLDERRSRPGKPDEDKPLTFLEAQRGGVTLEGVEVVVRLPESAAASATVVQVSEGDVTLRGCTVSAAGGRRGGVTLARLQAGPDGGRRCLLSRCFARGPALTLLAAEAPGAEVLIDACLVAGGDSPLLQVAADGKKPVNLRVVRSTLIGWKTLLEVRGGARPALNWFGWDSLLCRSSEQAGGDLAALPPGASADGMTWRAVNCLYAGWHNLLGGAKPLDVDQLGDWQRLWKRTEGEAARRVGWPVRPFVDPEDRPAQAFQADDSVAFAASVDPQQPLGCDLAALPPARDNWQTAAYERTLTRIPEPPSDSRPDAPPAEADPYEGGDLNLDRIKDLGAYLAARRLGKSVVLRLSGSGEKTTSPIRVKNADLTLYFEPPRDDKTPPLVLTHGDRPSEALIEVENGKLEVIGGEFRFYDSTRAEPPAWLMQVRGGDLLLSRCRLYGPQQTAPEDYKGLVRWQGCGDAAENKVQKLAITDSVLLSSRVCVQVEGIGARLLLRQSVLVAGTDALALELGAAYQGRAGWQGVVEHCTLAARRSAVHCGPAEYAGAAEEPALLQTRDCAFVNPFKEKDARQRTVHPGLLTADATSLGRGALQWQSEGDLYDNRLYFRAAAAPPEQPQGHAFWVRLLGTPGLRRPQPFDLGRANLFDDDRWGQQLERLALPPQAGTGDRRPGADVKKLAKKTP